MVFIRLSSSRTDELRTRAFSDLPASCGLRRPGSVGLKPETRCHCEHRVRRTASSSSTLLPHARKPEPATRRDQKQRQETRGPETATRDQRTRSSDTRPADQKQRHETRGPEAATRDQRTRSSNTRPAAADTAPSRLFSFSRGRGFFSLATRLLIGRGKSVVP